MYRQLRFRMFTQAGLEWVSSLRALVKRELAGGRWHVAGEAVVSDDHLSSGRVLPVAVVVLDFLLLLVFSASCEAQPLAHMPTPKSHLLSRPVLSAVLLGASPSSCSRRPEQLLLCADSSSSTTSISRRRIYSPPGTSAILLRPSLPPCPRRAARSLPSQTAPTPRQPLVNRHSSSPKPRCPVHQASLPPPSPPRVLSFLTTYRLRRLTHCHNAHVHLGSSHPLCLLRSRPTLHCISVEPVTPSCPPGLPTYHHDNADRLFLSRRLSLSAPPSLGGNGLIQSA